MLSSGALAETPSASSYPSLTRVLAQAVERHPDQALFRHEQGWAMSYAAVGSRALTVAARLQKAGLKPGEPIVCYLDDTVALALIVLGCALGRILTAPLAPSFSIGYLKRVCDQLGTPRVFTTRQRAADVRAAGLSPICFSSVPSSEHQSIPERGSLRTEYVMRALAKAAEGTSGEDPLFIQPTSGSTGTPKQVLRRHAGLTRYAHYVGAQIGHGPHRFLAVAALTHAFGWHMFATAISVGAEVVLPTCIDVNASIDEIRRLDPTVIPLTPRVLRSLCRQYVFRAAINPAFPMFGPSAMFLCSAGGRSEPKLLRFVASHGVNVIEFYGSSEASCVSLTRRGRWREGWSGHVLPDVRVKISGDGELLLSSPGLMVGYYKEEALTAAAYDEEGFYRTGDVGEVTPEGLLRILGRKKDVFNTPEGSNIHPERIELLLESQRWARQVMLIGDQRPYVTALVVLRTKGNLRADGERGFLDPAHHEELCRECGRDIARVNSELESIERVRAFLLFIEDFGEETYCVVGPAKVRRDRKGVLQRFARPLEWLYASDRLASASPCVVPL